MGETLNITLNASKKFEKGFVQIKFDVKRGKIEHAKIFGDFFGVGDVTDLENALVGCLHDFEHIEEALSEYDLYHYFGDIDRHELIRLMS